MKLRSLLAATAVCLSVYGSASAADYTFGSFEGTTLGGGWTDWNGAALFSNSTTGATAGTMSIKVEPGAFGYYQGLAFKIQDLPDNAAAFEAFVNNTHLAVDITYDPADFDYTGDGWNGGRLLMYYNEQGAGWADDIGVELPGDEQGFRVPNVDTGNPTNPGFWDLTNYPELHTRTMMWDYSSFLPALTSTATGGWTEFIVGNNFGNFNRMAFYMDNFRFTTPSEGQPGDFDDDGDVDGRDFLVWQRGGTTPALDPALLAEWQTNYGVGAVGAFGSIPEPGTIGLLAIAGAASLLKRKR